MHTVIRATDGSTREFPAGFYLQDIRVADWLHFAGVSLAAKQGVTPLFDGGSSAKWPLLRQTGVVSECCRVCGGGEAARRQIDPLPRHPPPVLARMKYTNRRTWDFPSLDPAGSPLLEIACEALPTAWGFDQGVTVVD